MNHYYYYHVSFINSSMKLAEISPFEFNKSESLPIENYYLNFFLSLFKFTLFTKNWEFLFQFFLLMVPFLRRWYLYPDTVDYFLNYINIIILLYNLIFKNRICEKRENIKLLNIKKYKLVLLIRKIFWENCEKYHFSICENYWIHIWPLIYDENDRFLIEYYIQKFYNLCYEIWKSLSINWMCFNHLIEFCKLFVCIF